MTARPSPARKGRRRCPGHRARKRARTRSWPPSPSATAAPARPAPSAPAAGRNDGSSPCCPGTWAEAQAAARAAETAILFQADYARRAGVEGTMHQAVSHGARRARYRGLPKTRLDHVYMACALNLIRLHAYWTGTPLDRHPAGPAADQPPGTPGTRPRRIEHESATRISSTGKPTLPRARRQELAWTTAVGHRPHATLEEMRAHCPRKPLHRSMGLSAPCRRPAGPPWWKAGTARQVTGRGGAGDAPGLRGT